MDVFVQDNELLRDNIHKKVVDWAEKRVMAGEQSEYLLILASLGLDAEPEREEVAQRLELYLAEQCISWPKPRLAALVWLRVYLDEMLCCNDVSETEQRMEWLAFRWFDSDVPLFDACASFVSSCYWDLFDDWGGQRKRPVDDMESDKFFLALEGQLAPWRHKLASPDWLALLTEKGD